MRLAVVAAVAAALASPAWGGEDLDSESQRLGYSIGYQVGDDFRRDAIALDIELLIEGVRQARAGAEPRMSPEQMRESLVWLKQASEEARRPAADDAGDP